MSFNSHLSEQILICSDYFISKSHFCIGVYFNIHVLIRSYCYSKNFNLKTCDFVVNTIYIIFFDKNNNERGLCFKPLNQYSLHLARVQEHQAHQAYDQEEHVHLEQESED